MFYLYDAAICDDLKKSFNPNALKNPAVKVIDPEAAIDLAAQLANDELQFPIVAIYRDPDSGVDTSLLNFTRLHQGVACVFDPKTNNYYNEKVLPMDLKYDLTVLTTSQEDMDEILRELIFKYTQMYFLDIVIPYESKRRIRFGVIIDPDSTISQSSGTKDYLKAGKLYQSILHLKVEGAVLVTYTPVHLRRIEYQVDCSAVEPCISKNRNDL